MDYAAPTISSPFYSCPGLATYWRMCKCSATYLLTQGPGKQTQKLRRCQHENIQTEHNQLSRSWERAGSIHQDSTHVDTCIGHSSVAYVQFTQFCVIGLNNIESTGEVGRDGFAVEYCLREFTELGREIPMVPFARNTSWTVAWELDRTIANRYAVQ